MSATSGYYAPAGQGWRLAYSLVTLAHELSAAYGDQLSCLGTVGDAAHAAENMGSDHNPFIRDPAAPSVGIVRAIDFGGPDALLKQIRQRIWGLYAATDPRVYVFGYAKGCSDNLINNWGLPFATHVDTGDAGHLHVSVTQMNGYSPSPSGYVMAIDSSSSWGFASLNPSGGGNLEDDVSADDVWNYVVQVPGIGQDHAGSLLGTIRALLSDIESRQDAQVAQIVAAIQQPVNYDQLAAAIVAKLPTSSLTPADVQSACEAAVKATIKIGAS